MEKIQIIEYLQKDTPEIQPGTNNQYPEIIVPNTLWHSLAGKLKNDPSLAFDYLFCLSGVDRQAHFSIVYHLESTLLRHELMVTVNTGSREEAIIDSVSDIWQTAEYHEREVYDLLGIKFRNHPDLRRLFLEDGWGFPLRKDYKDEINIIER